MSEASLAAQRLAVVTMRARSALTSIVPALNIFDRNERPESFPCVIIGEAQVVGDEADCLISSEVYLTLHLWTKETGFVACKSIAGEVRRALYQLAGTQDGFRLSFNFDDAKYLRDPSGELSHGVVTFMVRAREVTP
ncbi:DUF3168 domain-containing protein [Rhizobium sp. CFBP 13726]|uniref:DUF3168 domain-containing protein n=1 Tax=Rhizobium sp. CFBP 13726 TaxID=2775296 RepID=UPI0017826F9C|nr:DUF3168 domain-containing protein [Rhizobium sp. CFBP 13726]MBD8650814.1 DUF3168 domain-containing protein [Rhizobium sp. CFBP 13726]